MKQLFFILLVFGSFQLSAQGETEWKEDKSIPCDSNSVWGVDVLGNVYISTKDLVQKYDSVAVLKFSQSLAPCMCLLVGQFSHRNLGGCWPSLTDWH